MRLKQFQVLNFRSINDSGPINVCDRTTLVGRNESGKSNLLLALESLNPPGGMEPLSQIKDYPRDRSLANFLEELTVVESLWELDQGDQVELGNVYPRAREVKIVSVARPYKKVRYVELVGLPDLEISEITVQAHLTKVSQSINGALRVADETTAKAIKLSLAQFGGELDSTVIGPVDWATSVLSGVDRFLQAVQDVGFAVPERATAEITEIRKLALDVQNDEELHEKARRWIASRLPVFLYLSEYPELTGHQNIPEYLQRKADGSLTEADLNFEKLVKVAELNPAQLNTLIAEQHEERQQRANRAGALVTGKLREIWTDRQLTVRFNLDAQHFDTLIADPNAFYAVEVNLDERSRGFKWFFTFYVTFAADTFGGPAENAILLLDEPGLYLHATAQGDLLDHFTKDFKNQIVYTTHSPFMIPVNDLASIRTVNIAQDVGTTVTNDPTGDSRTLFPLQAALGYNLTQTMFVGQYNLVVEGVTDYWYLSAISDHLRDNGGRSLPRELVITPAGGAQKVSYMATLLAAQKLSVLVLLDDEKEANETAEELIRSKLTRSENVVSISKAFATPPSEADIEDLIDPKTFTDLVNQSYEKELAANPVTLNAKIPRIVKRYEDAFHAAGMEFHKTRPAKLFLRKVATDPTLILPATQQHFEALFEEIEQHYQRLASTSREPFER